MRIINLRRVRRIPDDAVLVDRTTEWGNPYVVGKHGTRAEVVRQHAEYLERNPAIKGLARRELRGKVLACWCDADVEPCHANNLWRVANEYRDDD